MNEWMNEWVNEWMNEWMNEWIWTIFLRFLLKMESCSKWLQIYESVVIWVGEVVFHFQYGNYYLI